MILTSMPRPSSILIAALLLAGCPSTPGQPDDDDVVVELDFDGDGWPESQDCDDSDASINPAAVETCATPWDDDCDGDANQPDAEGCSPWYPDEDGDGAGDAGLGACICTYEEPFVVTEGGDCDDGDPAVGPDGIEVDNGGDDDCDGQVDEGVLHGEDIQPIWNFSCLLCHIEGGYGGGLVLVNAYEKLLGQPSQQAPGVELVVPGDLDASYLWHKLNDTHEQVGGWGAPMPFESSLPAHELDFVEAWIVGGALP